MSLPGRAGLPRPTPRPPRLLRPTPRPPRRPGTGVYAPPRPRAASRLRPAGRRLRGGEHRQRHSGYARRAGRHRSHAGGRHRRLRRAAGHGGAGRARLPDRELLAPAHPRRHRLYPAQAAVRCRRQNKARDGAICPAGRITSVSPASADPRPLFIPLALFNRGSPDGLAAFTSGKELCRTNRGTCAPPGYQRRNRPKAFGSDLHLAPIAR